MVAVAQLVEHQPVKLRVAGSSPVGHPRRNIMSKKISIKLAVQKKGRLTEETLQFLKDAGLTFETYKKRLFSVCRNFPLEILYARDDDIGNFVANGTVDLGIIGQNLLYEKRPKVKKLLNLRFSFCTLAVIVPKNSKYKKPSDLNGCRIATSYPNSTKKYFAKNKIKVKLVKIKGSVEAAPSLGLADAIVDLVSTGSTLALNDLQILQKVYDSEAVLIANTKSCTQKNKKDDIKKLLTRFKGVLSASQYKLVLLNAPEKSLPRLKKIIPGLKSPAITPLAQKGWFSIQSVIKEDVFWETLERFKKMGISQITILPIEKILI